jgi:hypothetical protein
MEKTLAELIKTPLGNKWNRMMARLKYDHQYYGHVKTHDHWDNRIVDSRVACTNFINEVGARLGEPPIDEATGKLCDLDRYPDNKGNYYINNIRWATRRENCYNRTVRGDTTHGHRIDKTTGKPTPMHTCWHAMTARNTVCEEWKGQGGFNNFLRDMGERPENTTLRCIDRSKPYSKENCFWKVKA